MASGCQSPARRQTLHSALAAALLLPWRARAQSAVERLAVFSLLGDSVRIVARAMQEVVFKDAALDDVACQSAKLTAQERVPGAQVSLHRASQPLLVDEQRALGTAAAERGELPDWVALQAREAAATHLLVINSHAGAMEFRTGLSQVVGNDRVAGIGFYVGADGRTKNTASGAVSSGYLAPFVQLRLTLLESASRRVLKSTTLGDGFIVGPPTAEAPDPWHFLNRAEKAQALQGLVHRNVARGTTALLAAA